MTLLGVVIGYLISSILYHVIFSRHNRIMERMRVSIVREWVIFICRSSIDEFRVENDRSSYMDFLFLYLPHPWQRVPVTEKSGDSGG
jgi:hypothetical protein